MLGKIITENGVKKIKPLTADVGAGLPVGTWCSFENDVAPNANWIRAGTTFDASAYPVLASYLGTNVVPNKGTGLDWDNAETITLSTTDYEVTKSGWITCFAKTETSNSTLYLRVNGVRVAYCSKGTVTLYMNSQVEVKAGDKVNFEGTVNYQESHFIPYLHPLFIKATSGLSENQQDSVINVLNVSRSYSTNEILTGKTWIDGKPIYRKTVDVGNLPNNTTKSVAHNISNLDKIVRLYGNACRTSDSVYLPLPYPSRTLSSSIDVNVQNTDIYIYTGTNRSDFTGYVILEYTKTTD